LHDIHIVVYSSICGEVKLRNDQSIQEIIDTNLMNESKTRISNKKELALKDDIKVMETIWVCFQKQ
jgi:hypothetical protein